VSGNTDESASLPKSLAPERPSLEDDLASAKILYSEGLLEEAKRILYRMLLHSPHYRKGRELLEQISKYEIEHLYHSPIRAQGKVALEDPDEVVRRLESDLGLEEPTSGSVDSGIEIWKHSVDLDARSSLDLGIAFFEMGCFRDSGRELRHTIRQVLQETSTLGEVGLSATALLAESLILSGEAFDAKMVLEPVLSDVELLHEEKTSLYYLMGRAEECLGHPGSAKGWYRKVLETEPSFRDAEFRLRFL
jgi:tetratricopeptide (TPR) repeat protein